MAAPEAASGPDGELPGRSAVFGAFVEGELVGMAGMTRDRPIKASHRVCVWGVYVSPERRGAGVAKALLARVTDHARSMDGVGSLYLSVSEKTPAAKRLYESAGFIVWGLEPDCIRYMGESAREYHLSLALDERPPAAE